MPLTRRQRLRQQQSANDPPPPPDNDAGNEEDITPPLTPTSSTGSSLPGIERPNTPIPTSQLRRHPHSPTIPSTFQRRRGRPSRPLPPESQEDSDDDRFIERFSELTDFPDDPYPSDPDDVQRWLYGADPLISDFHRFLGQNFESESNYDLLSDDPDFSDLEPPSSGESSNSSSSSSSSSSSEEEEEEETQGDDQSVHEFDISREVVRMSPRNWRNNSISEEELWEGIFPPPPADVTPSPRAASPTLPTNNNPPPANMIDLTTDDNNRPPSTEGNNAAAVLVGQSGDAPVDPAPRPLHISPVRSAAAVSSSQSDFVRRSQMSSKRKQTSPLADASNSKKVATDDAEDDDEGILCPICYCGWTSSGKHRLCSLKCGHMFGHECIMRWLREGNKKTCPQCNTKASAKDVRVHYVKNLRQIDNTELEETKSKLDKERQEKREKEMELAKVRMQFNMANEECNRLKKQINDLQSKLSSRDYSSQDSTTEQSTFTNDKEHSYKRIKTVTISGGECRVMDFDEKFYNFAISQRSPQRQFMDGYGVKRISGQDISHSAYIPLHKKQIKDMKFSPVLGNHLLSASLDATLKITDITNTAPVCSYKCDFPVWSCCWHSTDRNFVYAGLMNGTYLQFDLRQTNEPYAQISSANQTDDRFKRPVTSLYHVPASTNTSFHGRGGLMAGTLSSAILWKDDGTGSISDFTPNLLPIDTESVGGCADVQLCSNTNHILVTFRPGRAINTSSHYLFEISSGENNSVEFNVVDTFYGGKKHTKLTRNALFLQSELGSKPEDATLLACTCNEETQTVMVYDANRNRVLQRLPCEGGPPLDVLQFHNSSKPMLAMLSESSLSVFSAHDSITDM